MSQTNDVPLESTIKRIHQQKERWANLPASYKLSLLDKLMDNMKAYGDQFHEASVRKRDSNIEYNAYKTLDNSTQNIVNYSSDAAHWLHSSMLVGVWLSQLREYFSAVAETGNPPEPLQTRKNPFSPQDAEQYLVKVGPKGLLYTTLLSFGSMELLVEGPIERENLLIRPPQLVTVMGAGNFDGPIDLLTAMFVENSVCIYKHSPFNQELHESLNQIFEPLLQENFLAFVSGGPELGEALISHECVDKWYITGSAATAYRILWGTPHPPKALDAVPKIQKPFTCELGNCTPWIVCPGKWSNMELDWHASTIAAGLTFNGGHICVHPQVIVTCANWEQRDTFLALIKRHLSEVKYVGCYYPDYKKRIESASQKLASIGVSPENSNIQVTVPISTFQKPEDQNDILFATDLPLDCFIVQEEMFSPICGEVALDTEPTIESFLPEAVKYVNTKVHGSLSVSVSVKAKTKAQQDAVDKAISDLNYGSVHINADSKMSIAFPCLVWGGSPGANMHDLNSGIGFLGNCLGYKRPIKSVIRAPFLNFTHVLLCPSKAATAKKSAKLWRRITCAVSEQRSTQGWLNYSGHLTKIISAYIANL